jgi:hypothetical protein
MMIANRLALYLTGCILFLNFYHIGMYGQGQDGIIIGDVYAKSAPSFDSLDLFSVTDKDLVSIYQVSENKNALNGFSVCDSFPWIEISNRDNKTGWVFGKYVFKILTNYRGIESVKNMTISVDSIDYHLTILRDFSIGPDDSNGLTGCPGFFPLLLYNADYSHLELIRYEKQCDNSAFFPYCNIVSDEGKDETIVDIETDSLQLNSIILKISYSLQDGGGKYDLRISKTPYEFVGEVENLQPYDPHGEVNP